MEQGNLRYTLNSKIQAVVYVQGPRGQYNKTFNATRSQSGAFNASNDEIQKVLGETSKILLIIFIKIKKLLTQLINILIN